MDRLTIGALAAHGDAPAIVSATSSLSYAELAARAQSVGRSLRKLGVLPGSAVGLVSAARSFDEAVGLTGILTSGCIAVPVDPSAPPQRLAAILKGRGCKALVCDEGAQGLAGAIDAALPPEDALDTARVSSLGALRLAHYVEEAAGFESEAPRKAAHS